MRILSGHGGHSEKDLMMEERRRLPATILLAPTHVQVAYTSTNTTKMLRSHGLLDEKPFAEEPTPTPRWAPLRRRKRRHDSLNLDSDLDSGPDSDTDTDTERVSSWTTHNEAFSTIDSDLDSDTECMSSRTTHNEAFSTMDASLVRRVMWLPQDASTEGSNRILSRFVRRGPVHPTHGAPHQVYIPPWVTLQSRAKQEERRRRHGVLSNSFEDIEVLPPKKSKGGTREKSTGGTLEKNVPAGGKDIFAQVPSDALFMLLPLWPAPTDPVSERNATRQPHEIPTEQRQYLLVSYKGTDEHAPPSSKKHVKGDRRSKKGSSHSSLMSSVDGNRGKGCNILWTSYHISARLVSHADLQGSGVRAPAEGLAVLGPWYEARLTMPPIATRDHGLLVIGTCASRDAGIEFDPEGLVRLGLGVPVPTDAALDEPGLQEKPVAELTPIGKAVLEMAWIGGIAVTSFGPAGSS
ncbi:hypothetical protein K438DRAFT_1848811 [Mycena galopus ATCC 62051]|nr:hypothetical protein K438DRAFT_1848811 [Mycena galopus ATCC 62051]